MINNILSASLCVFEKKKMMTSRQKGKRKRHAVDFVTSVRSYKQRLFVYRTKERITDTNSREFLKHIYKMEIHSQVPKDRLAIMSTFIDLVEVPSSILSINIDIPQNIREKCLAKGSMYILCVNLCSSAHRNIAYAVIQYVHVRTRTNVMFPFVIDRSLLQAAAKECNLNNRSQTLVTADVSDNTTIEKEKTDLAILVDNLSSQKSEVLVRTSVFCFFIPVIQQLQFVYNPLSESKTFQLSREINNRIRLYLTVSNNNVAEIASSHAGSFLTSSIFLAIERESRVSERGGPRTLDSNAFEANTMRWARERQSFLALMWCMCDFKPSFIDRVISAELDILKLKRSIVHNQYDGLEAQLIACEEKDYQSGCDPTESYKKLSVTVEKDIHTMLENMRNCEKKSEIKENYQNLVDWNLLNVLFQSKSKR